MKELQEQIFINLSNHPSEKWNDFQKNVVLKDHSQIIDIPFPDIDPYGTSQYIDELVDEYLEKVLSYGRPTVMVQGEYIFTYRMIVQLKKLNLVVLASCSDRRTIEYIDDNGFTARRSEFEFVEFKEY